MLEEKRIKRIANELKAHAPFTAFGAGTGIAIMGMLVWLETPSSVSNTTFHILHPLHILFSAVVTTAIYRMHKGKNWAAPLIGFIGSVGICSISDIAFPWLGAHLLGAEIELHICFIEHPQIIIPASFIGIVIGYWRPTTKFPHSGHVLLSTWASLFYLTAFGIAAWIPLLPFVFVLIFLAVWLPCCVSDIVFPLLFVKED